MFVLERGRCVMCGLDCHALVKRLQVSVGKALQGDPAAAMQHDCVAALFSSLLASSQPLKCCPVLQPIVQTIERGTVRWIERRRLLVAHEAPRFLAPGHQAQLEQLVKRAVPGSAWHADHIIPVYQGGGLCDESNLRTLCVLCHKDVTVQQARERAAGDHLTMSALSVMEV